MPKESTAYAEVIRVWHVPQVPGKPFYAQVDDLNDAVLVRDTLARYDAFEFRNRIKGDYCNASGIEYFDPRTVEWIEVEAEDIPELLDAHMGKMPLLY